MKDAKNNAKLELLAELEGYDTVMAMLEKATFDSVCPGICGEPGCDYIGQVEPDQTKGWCPACEKGTVKSALILAGLI